MFEFVKEINNDLYFRCKLIEFTISKPTVYIEIQAFFHTAFKYILKNVSDNDFKIKEEYICQFISSPKFVLYLRNEYNFYDISKVTELKDKYRNVHEHTKVASYKKNKVEEFVGSVFNLCKGIYEKETGNICPCIFNHAEFEKLLNNTDNDINELKKSLSILQKQNLEINKENKRYKNKISILKDELKDLNEANNKNELINKIQELESEIEFNQLQQKCNEKILLELQFLRKDLNEKIIENHELNKEINELSREVEYSKGKYINFMLPPQDVNGNSFYDIAVKLKRLGNFKESLHIYKNYLLKNNCVYDRNLFNAIYKVAMLDENYNLALKINCCMLHEDLKVMHDIMQQDSVQKDMLNMRLSAMLKQNRAFNNKYEEYREINNNSEFILYALLSENLIIRNYITEIFINKEKDIKIDDLFLEQGNAYKKLFRYGKVDTEREDYLLNSVRLLIENTEYTFDMIMDAISNLEMDKINDLALLKIYDIENLIKIY